MPPVFVVHGREQALNLRSLCCDVEILIPRHVAITGGPAFVYHLIQGLAPPPWVDCANHRGRTLGFIRMGVPRLVFDGPRAIYEKLADMGGQSGVVVVDRLTAPLMQLRPQELSEKVLRYRLAQSGLIKNQV